MTNQITQTPEKQLAFHLGQIESCEAALVEHAIAVGDRRSERGNRSDLQNVGLLESMRESASDFT